MKQTPLVYTIVLNYNGRDIIGNCLESLLRSDCENHRIVVVDNASQDGSPEMVAEKFPSVELIRNPENYYFSKGNNIGIQYALDKGAQYIFILNNDTTIEPDCISKLTEFMETSPDAGGCQPLLCFMDRPDLIASAGCNIALSGKAWDAHFGEPADSLGDKPFQMGGITGGAMFLRADAVKSAGMFCEKFQMYFEDVDLSLRLRENGWNLFCVPTARVLHIVSATTNKVNALRRIYFCERNSYWVVLRNYSLLNILKSFALNIPCVMAAALYNVFKLNLRYSVYILKALFLGLASFVFCFPQRGIESVRYKRSYPFWQFINMIIFPPVSKRSR